MTINNNVFKLTFPDGWKETTVYTFEGPHDSGIQHNVVLTVLPELPPNVALSDFAKTQTEASAGILPGFELISEKENSFFREGTGYEIVYRYRPSDEITFTQKQWYFAINKKVYLFSGTFNKKTLKTIGNEVEEIIRSFQVVNSSYDNDSD
jgi:hypothetical protein